METQNYIHTDDVHNLNSPKSVLPYLIETLPVNIESVVDVGCGTGTWLKQFQSLGVTDILGIDGHYVEKDKLLIEPSFFKSEDLRNPSFLNRKFDLVISLEVAEHLPIESADNFVQYLCSLSDNILFSAAIPNQGGQMHLNEQTPNYWREKFNSLGFKYYDVLRDKFWDDSSVDFWYSQNMFFVSKDQSVETKFKKVEDIKLHIHPKLYHGRICTLKGLIDYLKLPTYENDNLGVNFEKLTLEQNLLKEKISNFEEQKITIELLKSRIYNLENSRWWKLRVSISKLRKFFIK